MSMVGRGGNPPRRPDQERNYPPTGTQPGSSAGIVRARQVIVSGQGVTGVFVYAAGTTPGLGNPPIVSITNGTTDPYGNTVVPGLDVTQGSITGTTISASVITGSTFDGTDFILDNAGAFFYSSAPAAGNLIASIASAAGTDGFGNTFLAGMAVYNSASAGTNPGVTLELNSGLLTFGDPSSIDAQTFASSIGRNHQATTGSPPVSFWNSAAFDAAGSHVAIWLNGVQLGGGNIQTVNVFAANAAGTALTNSQFNVVGSLIFGKISANLPNATGPSLQGNGTAGSGGTTIVAVSALDGNTYDIGRLTQYSTSTTAINSTTPVAINGLTFTVGAGTYRVHGRIKGVIGAAGALQAQTIRFVGSGGTTVSSMDILVGVFEETNNATVSYGTISALNADPSLVGPATFPLNSTVDWLIDGIVTFSAGGSFIVEGRNVTSSADAPYTVQVNSFTELLPVVA